MTTRRKSTASASSSGDDLEESLLAAQRSQIAIASVRATPFFYSHPPTPDTLTKLKKRRQESRRRILDKYGKAAEAIIKKAGKYHAGQRRKV